MRTFSRLLRRRPSPAMVVALIALVVALGGTAVASHYVISASSQVRNGAITGADIRNRSVQGRDVARGAISLSRLSERARDTLTRGATATEGYRIEGPGPVEGGTSERVATLRNLDPGVYALFGKTVLAVDDSDVGLLGEGRSAYGHCRMEAGASADESRTLLGGPGALSPGTLTMHTTHIFESRGNVTLDCDAGPTDWRAGSTSLIAIRLARAPKEIVSG